MPQPAKSYVQKKTVKLEDVIIMCDKPFKT